MEHELKTWPAYFQPLIEGRKPFEWRFRDRPFNAGDTLRLREWEPEPRSYTGREITVRVTYVVNGPEMGIPHDYCIMGLNLEERRE